MLDIFRVNPLSFSKTSNTFAKFEEIAIKRKEGMTQLLIWPHR